MTNALQEDIDNKKPPIDFGLSIERLELRAKRSRRRVMWLSVFLAVSIVLVVAFLLASLSFQSANALRYNSITLEMLRSDRALSVQDPFYRHISSLMDRIIGPERSQDFSPPQPEELITLNSQLDEAIGRFERIRSIVGPDQPAPADNNSLVPILTTGIFSFGVIGIIVLIINICISFIRYHSQLAELYEAQSDALKASGGSAELAYQFAEKFSPTAIVMGKAPASLYEKALDVIKEVANRNTK